ncbi:hypothetical protein N1851_004991 [Merluccius polli]|uniref:Uncharacterized protein n=1 Tax=Merluccius polli TaxID=89951 RepID=A0AA47N6G2_MERPO|nr:hypothetical protein N1851_004991 [Merluccius polli]
MVVSTIQCQEVFARFNCLRFNRYIYPILQTRKQHSKYHQLVWELHLDEVMFQRFFRLTRGQFDEVLSKVGDRISKMDTSYREAIGPAERLPICLGIVKDVAAAILDSMVSGVMPTPTLDDWRAIAEDFTETSPTALAP